MKYEGGNRGRYVVVLTRTQGMSPRAISNALARQYGGTIEAVYEHVLGGFAVRMSEEAAVRLSEDPRVREVHEDLPMKPAGIQSPVPSWGLDRIDQQALPLNNSFNYGFTGAGVVAYILDTGVNNVGDVMGRIDGAVNFTTEPGTNDCFNHGTAVASTLGGSFYGVAKGVRFINVKVNPCGSGSTIDTMEGVDWVLDDHVSHPGQKSVANISLGASNYPPLNEAIIDAIDAGVVFVVAAGNQNSDACNYSPGRTGNGAYMANNPNGLNSISVGASTSTDARWVGITQGSNIGACVDLFAPGDDTRASGNDGTEIWFGGTSGAAPHVAGVAALHLERYGLVSPAMIESAIRENATANVLTGIPAGTPNLLLYSALTGRRRPCC